MVAKVLFIVGWSLLIIVIAVLLAIKFIREKRALSFEHTFNRTGLPIISLYNDAKQLNFLLDTGSDCCVINSKELKYLHYIDSKKKVSTVDTSGITKRNMIKLRLDDGNDTTVLDFVVLDLSAQFGEIYRKNKVRIHGILGSKFCKDAGLTIDFTKCKVY